MQFKPLNSRVLVKPDEVEKVTDGGIIIPDSAKEEKPVRGTVVVSGETGLSVGANVLFSRYGFDEVTIDNELFYVVSISNVLGIF